MDLTTVTAIRRELESELIGSALGKIFQLSKFDIAVDLRLPNSSYLFVSVEPGNPRVYLIKRRMRDLERASGNPSPLSLL
ncbi:MAG: NFACT family protein, partial [Blastocatellia bacterium]|nr:NFACT family protein [Blastocatellia bacterium]